MHTSRPHHRPSPAPHTSHPPHASGTAYRHAMRWATSPSRRIALPARSSGSSPKPDRSRAGHTPPLLCRTASRTPHILATHTSRPPHVSGTAYRHAMAMAGWKAYPTYLCATAIGPPLPPRRLAPPACSGPLSRSSGSSPKPDRSRAGHTPPLLCAPRHVYLTPPRRPRLTVHFSRHTR